ncbi:MAG: hypothetical protein A2381_15900 [Bdellovibrionales bacterium RIFOXYB1_FULL_37_110]|nr:MAG: hypothetical protein A2417_07750 [Bdellovibrionales bacterium RIFOXYC1_FULL_37_79]OFZ57097.1 MAG: hypothetical protein A2381_15900 [Bdellovibrionales bacterium RIFOXYB1_FULL_37_110]OFZ63035.1 MAG: hypothetical protein A2577_19750 [Bdellovibrionales bacterium RIFOXYD1_FULL_36_51]
MLDNKDFFTSEIELDKLILGDRELLSKFVSKYDRELKNAAKRMRFSGERLEDLVQATWICFFESVERFQKQSHIRTFLFGILLNKAREIWKKDKRETFFEDDKILEDIVNRSQSECNHCHYCNCLVGPEKQLNAKQLLAQLDQSFSHIDEKYAKIFYDRVVDEKNVDHLCRENQITHSNLGVIIHRVRKKLNQDFSRN